MTPRIASKETASQQRPTEAWRIIDGEGQPNRPLQNPTNLNLGLARRKSQRGCLSDT